MAEHTTVVGTAVEHLTQTDVGGRGPIRPIREAVAEAQGVEAAMQAAERLLGAVEPDDVVVILTGFLIPPSMIPETDGPPGAVSVARATDAGLDANPIIACEAEAVGICEATATAGGLSVLDRDASLESVRTTAVEAFPADRSDAQAYAEELLALEPAAVIAVEKVGPNRVGRYHNMAGYDITSRTAKVDVLFDALDEHDTDVTTVAVGDAGNEVGMGVVEETVREEIPYGDTCRCECGEGIAAAIDADVLVPAAVSNWGAHGVVTCLSALADRQFLHEPGIERRMLEAASLAGSVDGIGGGTTGWCDGLPIAVHESVVRLLREIPAESVHDRGGGELSR